MSASLLPSRPAHTPFLSQAYRNSDWLIKVDLPRLYRETCRPKAYRDAIRVSGPCLHVPPSKKLIVCCGQLFAFTLSLDDL